MADEKRDWSKGFRNNGDAAAGCNYIRWLGNKKQEHGNALLVLMIGVNSVVASMDTDLDPEDAIALLETEAETIAELLRYMGAAKQKQAAKMRPNRTGSGG
jgi:hypothetical protein